MKFEVYRLYIKAEIIEKLVAAVQINNHLLRVFEDMHGCVSHAQGIALFIHSRILNIL